MRRVIALILIVMLCIPAGASLREDLISSGITIVPGPGLDGQVDYMSDGEIVSLFRGQRTLAEISEMIDLYERNEIKKNPRERVVRYVLGVACIVLGISDMTQGDAVSGLTGYASVCLGAGLLTFKF